MDRQRAKVKLRRWCVRRIIQGWPIRKVADHAQTPPRTVYDWWYRFQRKGGEGLADASRRPHRTYPVADDVVEKVIAVRLEHGWCGEAISAYLKRQGIRVSNGSVYTILRKHNLPVKTYGPRKQRTYIRFQRAHPDSLWQTDFTYYGDLYLVAFLDDCSRYVPAVNLYSEATTDNVLETLEEALSNGRTPSQILTDHGTQYWSNDGPNRFTRFCEKHGIEHILGSIGKPTTLGKVERFFQTFELYYPRFNDLNRFREYYNSKPHRSLRYLSPSEVYFA